MWKWFHRGTVGLLLLLSLLAITSWLEILSPTREALLPNAYSDKNYVPIPKYLVTLGLDGELWLTAKEVAYRWTSTDSKVALGDWTTLEFLGITIQQSHILASGPTRVDEIKKITIGSRFSLIAILTAIYPAIFFIRSYRRRLRCQVLQPCTQCGYDLQGNESGVCPECNNTAKVMA